MSDVTSRFLCVLLTVVATFWLLSLSDCGSETVVLQMESGKVVEQRDRWGEVHGWRRTYRDDDSLRCAFRYDRGQAVERIYYGRDGSVSRHEVEGSDFLWRVRYHHAPAGSPQRDVEGEDLRTGRAH